MKKIYIVVLALFFAIPLCAQENLEKKDKKDDVYVWCVMPKKKGQWLKLTPPTTKDVTEFQEKLVFLELLNPHDIVAKGRLDRATSDAILKMEKINKVTYESKELVGFTQGMKNRLRKMYFIAKKAKERKEKQ